MATKEEILNTFTTPDGAWFAYKEGVQTGYNEAYNSLRNQAAIAAMQGLITVGCNDALIVWGDGNRSVIDPEIAAEYAVKYADSLIEQLKK